MAHSRTQRPIEYRDQKDRVWSVSEVAVLKVVSPAIDGPNLALVIRFEREGEERFARWLGGTDWREPATLHQLFESVNAPPEDTGVGPAPPETVALWVKLVASMGPDELADFETRTFRQWDRASLGDPPDGDRAATTGASKADKQRPAGEAGRG